MNNGKLFVAAALSATIFLSGIALAVNNEWDKYRETVAYCMAQPPYIFAYPDMLTGEIVQFNTGILPPKYRLPYLHECIDKKNSKGTNFFYAYETGGPEGVFFYTQFELHNGGGLYKQAGSILLDIYNYTIVPYRNLKCDLGIC